MSNMRPNYAAKDASHSIEGAGCKFPRGSAGITRRKFRDLTKNSTQVSHYSVKIVSEGGKGTLN